MSESICDSVLPRVHELKIHTRKSRGPSRSTQPVVLVHGLGVSADYVLPTLVRLAADFQVWAPELPGFGRSDKPRQVLNIHELADTLAEWARVLYIQSVVFLGNSPGCHVMLETHLLHWTLRSAVVPT